MAKVSLILPVYNTEKYLDKCLSSIERQTYQDFEIIAVNDGSIDSSLNILENYQKRFPNKMIILDKKNEGVIKARKDALNIASAPYLSFIDSDDYINQTYLESLVTALDTSNSNMAISRFAMHFNYPFLQKIGFRDKKRKPTTLSLVKSKEKLPTINVVTAAKLFKRDFFQMTDKDFEANEDLSINYLNFALADKIVYAKDALYHYCPNNNGLVSKKINGYSYQNMLNTLLPLEELKNNFSKHHMLEYYHQEIECLIIKNIFQRISTILKSDESREKQMALVNCFLSYMEVDFPNWRDNPYYQENFKTLEIPDMVNCLSVDYRLKKMTYDKMTGTKDSIMREYQKILK